MIRYALGLAEIPDATLVLWDINFNYSDASLYDPRLKHPWLADVMEMVTYHTDQMEHSALYACHLNSTRWILCNHLHGSVNLTMSIQRYILVDIS